MTPDRLDVDARFLLADARTLLAAGCAVQELAEDSTAWRSAC